MGDDNGGRVTLREVLQLQTENNQKFYELQTKTREDVLQAEKNILARLVAELEPIKENPMIKIGTLMKEHPKVATVSFVVLWLLAGVAAITAILTTANQLGISIITVP